MNKNGYTPPHLSASRISMYRRCPKQFELIYVQKHQLPPSAALFFGSSVHFGIEALHRSKSAVDAFWHHWTYLRKQLSDAGQTWEPDYDTLGPTLLGMYERKPIASGEPEKRWTVRHPELPMPLVGVFDIQGADFVAEHKTSTYPWKGGRVDREYQATLYAAAYPLVTGKPLEKLIYTVLSCLPEPQMNRRVWRPDENAVRGAIETAVIALQGMQAGLFEPKCPKGQCRFQKECGRTEEATC